MSAAPSDAAPSSEASPSAIQPGEALLHPAVVAALALWLLNDHLLKGMAPGWLSGKLSDVACLVVVPLMPMAALELWTSRRGRPWRQRPALLWGALLATGLVMICINLFDSSAWAYRHGLAALQWPIQQLVALASRGSLSGLRPVQLTMDPTDLWTLPALLVPLWVGRRRELCQLAQQRAAQHVPLDTTPATRWWQVTEFFI